ncbi:MAG: PD-(D/E)XK nuclease-like domain-containing protein, partial [Pseudomonadales bacterium]
MVVGQADVGAVDLKTTVDAREFERSVFTFGYDIQAAFYTEVAKVIDGKSRKFIWIVVEKDAPYGVQIY